FVLVVLLLLLLFFLHFFGQGQIISGLIVRRIVPQGLFVGFHRFLVFLAPHEHIAHIVEGLVFFGLFIRGLPGLFVAAKGLPKAFPVVIGIAQIERGRHVLFALGDG